MTETVQAEEASLLSALEEEGMNIIGPDQGLDLAAFRASVAAEIAPLDGEEWPAGLLESVAALDPDQQLSAPSEHQGACQQRHAPDIARPIQKMSTSQVSPSRWERLLREPEFAIAQLILWLFVALTSLQVIMRYVFDAPLTWPEELTQILLVWMTFIAAVGLSRKGLHVRVEFAEEPDG